MRNLNGNKDAEQPIEIKKITIDPHNCSREEYAELVKYLDDNHWDYRKGG